MPRKPTAVPSWHKASEQYCCYIDRKTVYLGADYEAALIRMSELRLARVRQPKCGPALPVQPAAASPQSLGELIAAYLEDKLSRCKPATYIADRDRLIRAKRILGNGLLVGDVKRFHLSKIQQHMAKQKAVKKITDPETGEKKYVETNKPRYSPTTIRDTISALVGCYSWAVESDLIEANPLASFKKPKARQRQRVMTLAEFRKLLGGVRKNRPLRIILRASRLTGCRPAELRHLRWDHVDLANGLWVIPVAEHKTGSQQQKPKPRIIPLSPSAVRICRLLRAGAGTSPNVFRNVDGLPWKKDGLCHAFRRARQRAGLEVEGENLVCYSNRHAFGTRAAKQLGILAASKLLGHTTTRVTERYCHLDDADALQEFRKKLGG